MHSRSYDAYTPIPNVLLRQLGKCYIDDKPEQQTGSNILSNRELNKELEISDTNKIYDK